MPEKKSAKKPNFDCTGPPCTVDCTAPPAQSTVQPPPLHSRLYSPPPAQSTVQGPPVQFQVTTFFSSKNFFCRQKISSCPKFTPFSVPISVLREKKNFFFAAGRKGEMPLKDLAEFQNSPKTRFGPFWTDLYRF